MEHSIAAIMIARNEGDVLPFVLPNTLNQVDKLFIINNGSTDNTEDVIFSFKDQIAYYENKNEYYNHTAWMTYLANMAIEQKFNWIVPIDADEMWSNLSVLRKENKHNLIEISTIKNHMFTNYTKSFHPCKMPYYKEERTIRNAFRSLIPLIIGEGSHKINGIINEAKISTSSIEIDHYPFRTEKQYIKKIVDGSHAMRVNKTPESEAFHWKRVADDLHNFKSNTSWMRWHKLG